MKLCSVVQFDLHKAGYINVLLILVRQSTKSKLKNNNNPSKTLET